MGTLWTHRSFESYRQEDFIHMLRLPFHRKVSDLQYLPLNFRHFENVGEIKTQFLPENPMSHVSIFIPA